MTTQPTVVASFNSGSVTTAVTTVTTGTISGYTPAAGDVVVVAVECPQSSTAGFTLPSGWLNALGGSTIAAGTSTGTLGHMMVFYHVVTSAEATAGTNSWSLTGVLTPSHSHRRIVLVVRGVDLGTPIDAVAIGSAAATNAPILPAVTPNYNNSLVIGFVGGNSASTAETVSGVSAPWSDALNTGVSMTYLLCAQKNSTATVAGTSVAGQTLALTRNDDWITVAIAFTAIGAPTAANQGDMFFMF